MNVQVLIDNKEECIKWLNKIKTGSGDARPLWHAMEDKITEFVYYQFRESDDSGKRWKRLTPKYKAWKKKRGFSGTIGTLTGYLKEYAGEGAVKKFGRTELYWAVNQSKVKYAKWFNNRRSIYKNVALRVNSFLSFDVKQFNDGSHNSFTYSWLRNALIEGQK
jgi:hypothetical protein